MNARKEFRLEESKSSFAVHQSVKRHTLLLSLQSNPILRLNLFLKLNGGSLDLSMLRTEISIRFKQFNTFEDIKRGLMTDLKDIETDAKNMAQDSKT